MKFPMRWRRKSFGNSDLGSPRRRAKKQTRGCGLETLEKRTMLTISVVEGGTTWYNDLSGSGVPSDDFGATTMGTPVQKTFTINNSDSSDVFLYGSPTLPMGFSLVGGFPTDVPPAGSATFTVQMDATMVGSLTGELAFSNSDPMDGYYQFGLSGIVNYPPPALTVKDGNTTVDNGFGSDDFGTTDAGVPVQKTFTIDNSSSNDIALFGPPYVTGDFGLVGSFPTTVPAGGSATFTLQLNASMVGSASGTCSFSDGDPSGGYYSFDLNGTVNYPPPALTVKDGNTTVDNGFGSDDFGTTVVGSPIQKTFTIYNDSSDAVSLFGSPSLPAGFSLVGTFPSTVPAHGSATFIVGLDASSVGYPSGQASFSDSDPGSGYYSFTISGTVNDATAIPVLQLSDGATTLANGSSDSFGEVGFGAVASKTFTVSNLGGQTLTVSAISLPSGFSLQTQLPLTINPAGSANFIVSMNTTASASYSGAMTLTSNDSQHSPLNVSISGTVDPPSPHIVVSDGGLTLTTGATDNFANTFVGVPETKTFTIHNTGSANLTVGSLQWPSSGFTLTASPAATIAPGASTTISLRLDASATGSYSGQLTFADNDPAHSSFVINVGGQVVAPSVSVGTMSLVNDTGLSNTDQITSDAHVTAAVSGNFTGGRADVEFQASTDGGVTDLADGLATVATPGGSFTFDPRTALSSLASYQGPLTLRYRPLEYDSSGNLVFTGGWAAFGMTLVSTTAPQAHDDSYRFSHSSPLVTSAVQGVTANDTNGDPGTLVVQLVSGVQHGTLTLNSDGSFDYAPVAGYIGADSFRYQLLCGGDVSNVATATVSVTDALPVSADDSYEVVQDQAASPAGSILNNDTDADGDPLTAVLVANVSHGVLDLNADGAFTYTPASGYLGSDSFTYRASDGFGQSNLATVSFDVNEAASVARNDAYSVVHDHELSISAPGVLSNDGFAGGSPLTVSLVTNTSHGSLTLNADGSFNYTPAAGFVGDDTFTYQATDGGSVTGAAAVTIHVTDLIPVAVSDSYAGFHDRTLSVSAASGVLANDADANGDVLTAQLVAGPAHGSLTLNADGSLSYVPSQGYVGGDSFTYQAGDGVSSSAPVTVQVSITNSPPESADDYFVAAHDRVLTVGAANGVLANDTDAESDAISAALVTGPAHGSLVLNPDGGFAYTPAAGYVGSDSFTYLPSDGISLGAAATATILVENHGPHVFANSYQVGHDKTLAVSAAKGVLSVDSDAESDPLSATLASGPASGQLSLSSDGSFTYTPNAGFVGTDQFTYIAGDGLLQSSPVTITLQVIDQAPATQDDSYTLQHDTQLTADSVHGVLANDHDDDGNAISAVLLSGPNSGTLSFAADGSFAYTPNAGFVGTDHFTYKVTDGAQTSGAANVTLTVLNPSPFAQDDVFTLLHDATLSVAAAQGVLLNDFDPDGESVTAQLVASVAHGSLTLSADGSFTYVPSTGFVGSDSFTYRVSDAHGASDPATVTLTVTNQSPSASEADFSTFHGQTLSVSAAMGLLSVATDLDGDSLKAILQSNVSHGTLSLAADGSFVYTPDAGFIGSDSFTFTVNDGVADSVVSTATIDVTDNAPLAIDDAYAIGHDQTLTVNAASGVLGNDSDEDPGDALIAQLAQQAANGTVTLQSNGSFTYAPNPGFHGTDSFIYQASDGILFSDNTTVTIDVGNDGPRSAPDAYSVVHDRTLAVTAAQGVLANDSDPNGDPLAAALILGVNHGTLTLQADGSFIYAPSAGYVGPDGFSYRASDGAIDGDVVNVIFDVTNQAPTAAAASYSTNQDQALVVNSSNVLTGAADADGDGLTAQLVAGPSHGTLTLELNGDFTYQPDAGYSGSDSFSVAADDGLSQSPPATVTITVTHVNHMPTASPPSFTVHANHSLSGNILAGASDSDGDALTTSLVAGAAHGAITLNSDGSFTYTPATNYVGGDSFFFTVSDGTATTDAIQATINVANAAPIAQDASYVAYLTSPLTAAATSGLLAHASDADGDRLTAMLVSAPGNGTLTLNADGSFSYTANPGFTGADTFTYAIQDGLATSNTASVTIQVTGDSVVAAGETYSVVHDRPLTTTGTTGVLRNDWAVDGGAIAAELISGPAHGALQLAANGSFQYIPAAGYAGADQFTYRVTEGAIASQEVTTSINVTNSVPVTAGEHYSVLHDATLNVAQRSGVLANDYDIDGDAMKVQLITSASHGDLVVQADGSFTYAPAPGYVGDDNFSYEVLDGAGTSVPAVATISVTDHAPSGQDASYTIRHGQSLSVAAPGVRAFDYDADADATSIVLVSSTSHGSLTLNQDGSFSYAPALVSGNRDFVGSDSFTYRLFDGAQYSDPITVSIGVGDSAPQGNPDSYATHFNAGISANVLANDLDADGDALTAVQLSQPAHGTVTLQSNGSFTYSPAPPVAGGAAFVGVDSFTYAVDDNGLRSSPIYVTIDLTDTAPVASTDLFQVQHGGQLSGNVLANDWDADSDGLQAFLAPGSGPSHVKQFQFNSDGTFVYTPADGFAGTDAFSYRIGDGANYSAFVTTTIQVTNESACAVNDFVQAFSGQAASGNVLLNDLNADGDSLSVSLASGPSHGVLTLNNSGDYVYQADGDYNGADNFTYRISDGVNTSQAAVYISVIAAIAKAEDDSYTVDQSAGSLSVTTSVLANDITTPGIAVNSQVVAEPQHGSLNYHADGSFTYTPNKDFAGADDFQYEVMAPGGATSTATVSINVTQQPPTANDVSFTADEGGSLSISSNDLLASDDGHGGTLTTATIVTQPRHGTLTWNADHWVYQSDPNFHGVDSFQYLAKDGAGEASNPARVSLTVNRVAQPVIAVPDGGVTTRENQPVTIDVLANDMAGTEPLDPGAVVSLPSSTSQGGSLAIINNQVVYTPNTNWSGPDHFKYTVTDAAGRQSQSTVNVSVTAVDTMTAQDMSVGAVENLASGFSLPQAVMLQTRYVEIISPPSHGTVKNFTNGNLGYLPDPDFVGDDTFQYKAYDSNWNSATGTITIHVAAGADLPKDYEPPLGSFNESPQPEYTTTDPMLLMMPEWQSSVDIPAGDTFTSARYGIMVRNNSAGPVHADFSAAHVSIAPIAPVVPDYNLEVEGTTGYADATWGGPAVRSLSIWADGSVSGVDLPGTLVAFAAGNTIGDVTAGTVYEMGNMGVGAVVASGNVAIWTGGSVPSVQAGGDIGFVNAREIDGAITAQGVIGVVSAVDDINGSISASGAYIGSVIARNLLGDVTASNGDIGFGDVPDWAINVGYFALGTAPGNLAPGVTAKKSLSGSIQAPAGRIAAVHGGTITSPSIHAQGDIYLVAATDQIKNSQIISDTGFVSSVSVGRGGISQVTVKAALDIGGGTPDSVEVDTQAGLEATAGVGSAGPMANVSIQAGRDIVDVLGLKMSNVTINADRAIDDVSIGDSFSGTIKAGGDIGRVSNRDGNWPYLDGFQYFGGLSQDIAGTITAGGSIGALVVGRDLSATVKAVDLPSVIVGRDSSGTITASGDIGAVSVGRTISQPITGGSVATVQAGYDIASGGNITSNRGIESVVAGHTLAGNVKAAGGDIGQVAAGSGYPNSNTSDGAINGATISAAGSIGGVAAIAGPGYGGVISGATITAEHGDIGSVTASGGLNAEITAQGSVGNVSAGGINGGSLDGEVDAETGDIGAVLAADSISANLTAQDDIGSVIAGANISGTITAGHSIPGGVTADRNISGDIEATSGDVGELNFRIIGISAGAAISGNIKAGHDIGGVWAGAAISGDVHAGADLGDVVAGTSPAGGDISGNLSAGGSIGDVTAWGGADTKDIDSNWTPRGLVGNNQWWLQIILGTPFGGSYIVTKPDGEPSDGAGNISGTIRSGDSLGKVTAYGKIEKQVSSGTTMGRVWALSDISGDIKAGVGSLQVDSWGTISGDLTAPGDIIAGSYDDISGNVLSKLASVALTAWGDIKGAVQSRFNATLWALGDIMSSSVVSEFGEEVFTAFGSVIGSTVTGANFFVTFAGNIENCTFTSDLSSTLTGTAEFRPGPALFYVWGDITGTTINVAYLAGLPGNVPNPFGYVSIIAGGNVSSTTIDASIGVDVLCGDSATGDTIDTSAGASIAAGLQSGGSFLSQVGSAMMMPGTILPAMFTRVWGALLTGIGDEIGFVVLMAEKGADATVTSPTCIQVATLHAAGTYTGKDVEIDAWNGADLGTVEGSDDVDIFVHGNLSGSIDSSDGTVEIETSGDVTATVTGKWSATVKTAGACKGSVTSASGPVAIDAYGDVSGPVNGKVFADVHSWTGKVSGAVDTLGYAKINAGGGSTANVTAGGNVVIVSLADVSGTIKAGNGALEGTWLADIDAEGNVSGDISASDEVSVDANGDISAKATSTYSTIEFDAAGNISSADVHGAGDVTLLGAMGVNVGDVTSDLGSIFLRSSGGDVTVTGGSGATWAGVIAGGNANATLTMNGSQTTATITAVRNATANVTGNCASVAVSAGGAANVDISGANGGAGPAQASVVSMGALQGSIAHAGAIAVTGWGGVNLTADALNSISVVSGAGLQGTYTSGGSLSAEAQGAVSGSYTGADGGVVVVGKTSVDGQVKDTTGGAVTVASLGNVGASITATLGDAFVTSGGAVSGAVGAGDDANVSALGGAVSGAVTAQHNAGLLAKQGVTAPVQAGQDASLVAFGDVTSSVTATAGAVVANVYATLSGSVKAGTTATVYADSAESSVIAGGDATITSKNTITGDVNAGGNATLSSVQGVQSNIEATGAAFVFAVQDIAGSVDTTNGDVTINCGGALSSTVNSGRNANLVSLGQFSGTIIAGGAATITGWSNVAGSVTTHGGDAVLYANGNLSATVDASASANATIVGDVTGDISASANATVRVGGQQSGQIDAGGDVSVTSSGECSGEITAGSNATIESFADITSQVVAGGNVKLDTWSNINSDNVQAGGSATLEASGNLTATIEALSGTIDAETMGTAQVTATAQGDITLDSLGAVSATTLTSNAGSVDVEVSDNATLTVQADQDASILVTGDLNGAITTTHGDVEVDSLGALTGTFRAGRDAALESLGDASGATISAARYADLTAFGSATSVSVSGDLDASAWAGEALSGNVTSALGDAGAFSFDAMNVVVNAEANAYVDGLANVQADVTSGGESDIGALGSLSGPVRAGTNAYLFSGGDLVADVTAGGDAFLETIGAMTGTVHAGHDLGAAAYGDLDATDFHAVHDVMLIWARGDITGSYSADGAIDQVVSYGSINASLVAPTIVSVAAFGPVGGSFTASTAIDSVASGGAITAALNSPSVGSVAPYQHGLLTDWPSAPVLSDAAEIAQRDAARAELLALAAQMAADKSAALAALPAERAAAAPSFAVSIGDLAAATAWFQNAGLQLAAQIASAQYQDQLSLSAAQTALTTYFTSEDARLAAARAGNLAFFETLKASLAKITADRESAAVADEAAAQAILQAAASDRAALIQKLDHVRDYDWPLTFETELFKFMLDRLQNLLDIVGIIDPYGIADGINAIISAGRGNFMDAGISAFSALVPYLGDLSKLLKLGKFGKFADDGLEALRRVAADFLNVAAKGAGYANACDAAAQLGRLGKKVGELFPIGCFGADTEIVMAHAEPESLGAVAGAEWATFEDREHDRWLWASLLAGAGFAGYWAANRAQRRKQKEEEAEQAALDQLFGCDEEIGDRDDDIEILATARQMPADRLLSPAACAAFAECAERETPFDLETANRALSPFPRNPAASESPPERAYPGSRHRETSMKTPLQSPTKVKNRGQALAGPTRGRSRFGVAWLSIFLGIAAWVGFGPSISGTRLTTPSTVATVVASPAAGARASATRRIADVRVGDRVKADNPTGEEDFTLGAEVDPASWRKLVLRASKQDGTSAEIELLRPLTWIEERGAKVGGTAPISVPECGIDGNADVLAIEPCPPIKSGDGRVVTGTFRHASARVMDLAVEGLESPIVTTRNHLFWSADREQFVRADALQPGEHVVGTDGPAAVASAEPRHEAIPVYNLEVHVDHAYRVGSAGIIVHNSADDCWRLPLSNADKARLRTDATDLIHSKTGVRASWYGMDVHHEIPLEWTQVLGKNPNRPENLIPVDKHIHWQITEAWNEWKRSLGGRMPTPQELLRQKAEIKKRFGRWFVPWY